jgi:soluble lytic murein transglycosylase-like protein
VNRPQAWPPLLGAAVLLATSCASSILPPPRKFPLLQPAESISPALVEQPVVAAPQPELPAAPGDEAPAAEPADPAAAEPSGDGTAEIATPPSGLPFVDEVEQWRPQVRALLDEVRAEGRLTGAASGVDEDLVLAVIEQESSGDPEAESGAGALGLMQLMPETFAWIMGIHDWGEDVSDVDRSQILDVPSNLRAGIRFLAAVLDEQSGSLYWALASYNAGGGVVNRWRAAGFSFVPAGDGYEETANYAPAILGNYAAHHPAAQAS